MARAAATQAGVPLSSLHGWIEMLREREDPMLAQMLVHIEHDVERLERVTSRIERAGSAPRRDTVDLTAIAHGVLCWFGGWVPTLAHPITLRFEAPDGACMTSGDGVLLEWAVESLVQNAIDALAERGGSIVVGVAHDAAGGVRMWVADDGPGVPRELRRKIFSAGFSTRESGRGMGLAIARRVVETAHGGRVRIVSSDNGAHFEIVLSA